MSSINNIINQIAWIAFAFLLTACSTEEVIDTPEEGGNFLRLAASRTEVTTKAPTDLEAFAQGTKYSIYAMNAGSTNFKTGSYSSWGEKNPKECSETKDHNINYGTPISLGINEVDFYGLTFGTSEAIIGTNYVPTAPNKIIINSAEQKDLMFSNHLKKCNSSQGTLQMNFKHAKSKLLFKIYKADETGYSDEESYFKTTTLKKIEIITAEKAEFNVFDNTWSNWQKNVTLTYFANTPQKLTTQATPVPGETLIIPNSNKKPIKVKIYLDNVKEKTGNTVTSKTMTYIIKNKNGEIIQFEPNHQYVLNIGVLREKGKIVIAFDPLVVPWEDVNIDLGDTSQKPINL